MIDGAQWVWILSTDFGRQVFVMIFLTWGLIIVDLFLLMLVLIRKLLRSKICTEV